MNQNLILLLPSISTIKEGNTMKYHEINLDDNFYDSCEFDYELLKELLSDESESISEIIEKWCLEDIGCYQK